MNLFCKMIIGCNLQMIDFITHWHSHCVLGVGKELEMLGVSKDSRMLGVDKDSGHGT